MQTEYLKDFLMTAKTLNYATAASNLYISHSSLYKHIKALEEDLGGALFDRDGRFIVNCIQKGAIERLPSAPQPGGPVFKDMTTLLPTIPQGRMGTPEDLAGAICYLASEEAAYVTGTVLDLSGGLSLV